VLSQEPATQQQGSSSGVRNSFPFLSYNVRVPLPHQLVFNLTPEASRRMNVESVSVFIPQLISGKSIHHLTSRLFLLKPHTFLFISSQTAHLESPQAARILPRNSAVRPQYIVEFGELSPRFDI
jgi:hypothetical protein